MANVPEKKPVLSSALWGNVSQYLSPKELANATKVSKVFKEVMDRDKAWQNVAEANRVSLPAVPKKMKKAQVLKYFQEANVILEKEFPDEAAKYNHLDPVSKYNAFQRYLIKIRIGSEAGRTKLSTFIKKLYAENPQEGAASYILLETLLRVWAENYPTSSVAHAVSDNWTIPLLEKLIQLIPPAERGSYKSPFDPAVQQNNLELVNFFLENKFPATQYSLLLAVRSSNLAMVKLFLENGALSPAHDWSSEIFAQANDKQEILALLKLYKPL